MQLTSLHPHQLALFAGVLVHYNNESSARHEIRAKRLMKLLRSPLTRPGFISRIYQPSQKSYTPLCRLHKPLNAKAVHQAFTLVSVEVGVRLNHLIVSGRSKNGRHDWDNTILNLRSLHGMWLAPDIMNKTFGSSLDLEEGAICDWDYMTKWKYQADGCEACMLSRMAGDLDTIMDLRLAVESRMFPKLIKKHGEPRLWPLVEEWIACWKEWLSDTDTPKEVERRLRLQENTVEVFKLNRKTVMKEQKRARREGTDRAKARRTRQLITEQRREIEYAYLSPEERTILEKLEEGGSLTDQNSFDQKSAKGDPEKSNDWSHAPPAFGLPPMTSYEEAERENEAVVEVEETAHDTENEIIDAYLALISTPFLPNMNTTQHAKAESVLSNEFVKQDNREQHRIRVSPYAEIKPVKGAVAYSESAYSTDTRARSQCVPPRSGWNKDFSMSQPLQSSVKRRKDIDTASAVSSWVDASVPPSIASLNLNSAKISPREAWRKNRQSRHSTIVEEESPVSPMSERGKTNIDRIHSMKKNSDSIRRRRRRAQSPDISPVSPQFNDAASSQVSPRTIRYNQRDQKRSHSAYPTPEPEVISTVSSMIPPSPLRPRRHKELQHESQTPRTLKPRLSRPFDDPAIDHINLSSEVSKPSRSKSSRTYDRPSSTIPKSPISRSHSHRSHHSHSHHHSHHHNPPGNPFSSSSASYTVRPAVLTSDFAHIDNNNPPPTTSSSRHHHQRRRSSEMTTFSGMMRGFDPALGTKLDEYDRGYEEFQDGLREKARGREEKRKRKEASGKGREK